MPIPTTGEPRIDALLGEVVSKGFALDSSGRTWMLRDPEHNELGFDPGHGASMPLLERLLRDALAHGTLCPAWRPYA